MKRPMHKEELRARFKAQRAALPEDVRAEASRAMVRRILESDAYRKARLLLAYYPTASEVDLRPLWEAALKAGKRLAFPRCEGNVIRFYTVCDLGELVPARFGIPSPREGAARVSDFSDSLCIVPALSADPSGTRLGYGGGFYDRFLAENPNVATLCAVFESLLSESLPCEKHDRKLAEIITETGRIECHDA